MSDRTLSKLELAQIPLVGRYCEVRFETFTRRGIISEFTPDSGWINLDPKTLEQKCDPEGKKWEPAGRSLEMHLIREVGGSYAKASDEEVLTIWIQGPGALVVYEKKPW